MRGLRKGPTLRPAARCRGQNAVLPKTEGPASAAGWDTGDRGAEKPFGSNERGPCGSFTMLQCYLQSRYPGSGEPKDQGVQGTLAWAGSEAQRVGIAKGCAFDFLNR